MPYTEKSAGRTANVEAYPLCDRLEYVAGDYSEFADGKNLEQKHKFYLEILEDWTKSEYKNQKIESIFNYVSKGKLINDILDRKKNQNADTFKEFNVKEYISFVRWNVEIPGEASSKTWKDPEIQMLWIDYYTNCYPKNIGFCYVTGQNKAIAQLHPAKIRNAGDSAKLISANDKSNFTYRGRFSEPEQACQVSLELSTKAHNALRWLIERQGSTIGNGLTIVAWCTAPETKPYILNSSHDSWDDDDENNQQTGYYTADKIGEEIRNRLLGYYEKLIDSDKILIMVLNAATPGRMSILLYREFIKSDFFEAQEYWHTHLAWYYTYWIKGEKKPHRIVSSPSPNEIVEAAYGKKVNDNVKAMAIQRLLSCIIDKAAIPVDIEQLCFSRASKLYTLDSSDREKTLETACAVIKYNLFSRKTNPKEYNVGLEEKRKDRDYLYGRLLAVADRLESRALYLRDEYRDTNAVRFMQRFARYPCSTWQILYVDKLKPYFSQLNPKSRDWYKSLIQEIESLFDHDEFVSDKKLSGEFLLGYHCQQKAFWDGIAKAKQKDSEQPEPGNNKEE